MSLKLKSRAAAMRFLGRFNSFIAVWTAIGATTICLLWIEHCYARLVAKIPSIADQHISFIIIAVAIWGVSGVAYLYWSATKKPQ